MGLIPAEVDKEDQKKQEEEKLKRVPRVGDIVFLTIKSKIETTAKSMTQLEFSELKDAGILSDPIFTWVPAEIITPDVPSEEMKDRKPKVGEMVKLTIRGKIITISAAMTQIEICELKEHGLIQDPIFMWMPTPAVTPHILGTNP